MVEYGRLYGGINMKKLQYNEITREIDIIEQEQIEVYKEPEVETKIEVNSENIDEKPKDKPRKENKKILKALKKRLKRNKIFFEIFSLFFLGVMGAVISGVGLKVNQKTAEIYQKQLEILDNDREPYFTINSETIFKRSDKDSYYIQMKYTIKNEGGLITEAFIKDIGAYAIIHIPIHGKNNYKNLYFRYEIEDKFSMPNSSYFYNEETKEFVFYGVMDSDHQDFATALEQELNSILGSNDTYIGFEDYIEIFYVNYKNDEYRKKFQFTGNSMVINENDDRIFINIKQRNDITLIAQEIIEHVEEWKKDFE